MTKDHIRILTRYVPTDTVERSLPVTLDVEARVYSICLSAEWVGSGDPDPNVPLAKLQLQDSEGVVYPTQSYSAIVPGLHWPAHARLVVAANVRANLQVTYGVCSGNPR